MRHKVKRVSLGKDRKHRIAILRNLAHSFIRHERIKTTKAKVRLFKSFIEKLITRAKVDNLHNRRILFRDIKNTALLKKLFENIAKRYQNRPGGYTRVYKLVPRIGDAAEMCIIELVPEFLDNASSDTTDKTSNKDTKNSKSKNDESTPISSTKQTSQTSSVATTNGSGGKLDEQSVQHTKDGIEKEKVVKAN